ncbi:hypothetical protein B0H11DRAFT_2365101 [Mycena galericulata]|nr:hypothetical protein B0H11DRAFT_2365101 [Mycena galericulata]
MTILSSEVPDRDGHTLVESDISPVLGFVPNSSMMRILSSLAAFLECTWKSETEGDRKLEEELQLVSFLVACNVVLEISGSISKLHTMFNTSSSSTSASLSVGYGPFSASASGSYSKSKNRSIFEVRSDCSWGAGKKGGPGQVTGRAGGGGLKDSDGVLWLAISARRRAQMTWRDSHS